MTPTQLRDSLRATLDQFDTAFDAGRPTAAIAKRLADLAKSLYDEVRGVEAIRG